MERTLHSWTQTFWQKMPLPVAELGAQLSVEDQDYLRKLFALTEATFGLGVAYGMARVRAHVTDWPAVAAEVSPLLRRSSLGNRHQALILLHRYVDNASGWEPKEPAPLLAGIVRAVLPDQASDRPTVAQGMSALVRARNLYAHPSSGASPPIELLRTWEEALQALLETNRLFVGGKLILTTQVRREPDRRWSFNAQSLQGPIAMPYRRGGAQPSNVVLEPQQAYLRMPDHSLLDLHPFVVADGQRSYVLGELKRVPVLWRPLTGESPSKDMSADFDRALPGWRESQAPARAPTPVEVAWAGPVAEQSPAVPESIPGGSSVPRWGLAAALVAVGLGLAGAGMALLVALTGDEDASAAAPEQSTPTPTDCTGPTPQAPSGRDLPLLLTGKRLAWGHDVNAFQRQCGVLEDTGGELCTQPILGWKLLHRPSPIVPGATAALAFHHRRGLFEVLVFTHTPVEEMERRLEPYLSLGTRTGDANPTWSFGDAKLRIAPTRDPGRAQRHGRTVVRAWQLVLWDQYMDEYPTHCPR